MKNSKIIIFIMIAISWLLAVSLRGLAIPILARFEVSDAQYLGFSSTAIGAMLLGVLTFFILNRNPKVIGFTDEVINELKKVTWPDKDETVHGTVVVIGLTLFIAAALGIYDYVWAEVTQIILFSQG